MPADCVNRTSAEVIAPILTSRSYYRVFIEVPCPAEM
jgi:hypothetical protein